LAFLLLLLGGFGFKFLSGKKFILALDTLPYGSMRATTIIMDGVHFPRTEVFGHAVVLRLRIHCPEHNGEGGLENKEEYSEWEACCSCRQRCSVIL
jgi:hypothetical protein